MQKLNKLSPIGSLTKEIKKIIMLTKVAESKATI